MNFYDMRFSMVALGVGIGLGVSLSHHHGLIGFFIGFVVGGAYAPERTRYSSFYY